MKVFTTQLVVITKQLVITRHLATTHLLWVFPMKVFTFGIAEL